MSTNPLTVIVTASRSTGSRVLRVSRIGRAFFRIGYLNAISYPLAFITTQLSVTVPAIVFYFVSQLTTGGGAVAGDYYTYVIIGMFVSRVLDAALRGFETQLDIAIQKGTMEMLLVEPIRWRLLPFGMVQFELVTRCMSGLAILGISLLLGAQYRFANLPAALVLLTVGLAASLAVSIVGASIMVLSKRSDPLLVVYTLAAQLLSGVYFPVQQLPDFVQPVSLLIPHTYVNDGLRRLLMTNGDALAGPSTGSALLSLLVFCAIVYPIGLWLFGRSLEYGRKLGVLAGY